MYRYYGAVLKSRGQTQPTKNRVWGTRKGPHENIGPSESVGAKWSVRSRRARDRLGQRVRPSANSRGPRRIHSTRRIKHARRHLRLTSARFYLPLHQCIGGTRSPDATEIGATGQRRAWAPRRQTRAGIRLCSCGKARERPAWRGTVERGVRIGTALNAACSMRTGSEMVAASVPMRGGSARSLRRGRIICGAVQHHYE